MAQTTHLIYASSLLAVLGTVSCGARTKDAQHRDLTRPVVTSTDVKSEPGIIATLPAEKQKQANESLVFADSKAVDAAAASQHVSGQVTLKKSEIFNRTFLYGFDMQYSATGDAKLSLLNQSMALGHVPATFRQLGDHLQLVADNQRLFESEVNHPETLISEYKITHEDESELTITIESTGLLVHKTVNGPESKPPLKTWVRSIEYIAEGNYLLQETAIMLENGEVQTYLESVFPRETLVPANYVGLEDNREKNPSSARFMLIGNEKVFVERTKTNGVPVREKTQFANRFHLPTETSNIDWYLTTNNPDDILKEIESGIEGWNRYFHDQLGRDVMVFKGRLPKGIKLGDPRYNVINFDSVAQAGAAYESQASDPMTGIQSHSVIYMPYAWYNIASKLISSRENPEVESTGQAGKIGPKAPEVLFGQSRNVLACVRMAEEVGGGPSQSELATAKTDADRKKIVDDFGRRVFISTLFHEVGHSLGLNHNFKGSLSYDGTKPDDEVNATTYTVMDYNYYQHEIDLVQEIGTSDGPRLEYDRQIISFLYNNGKDIKETDKKIAACNDEDADSIEGGVDPDCMRYDAEYNPLVGLEHAAGRLNDGVGALGIEKLTLAQSVGERRDRLASKLSDATKVPDAKTAEVVVNQAAKDLAALIGYYVTDGAQSLRVNLTINAGALRAWSKKPAEDGVIMPEKERRERYLALISTVASTPKLSQPVTEAIKSLKEITSGFILQSDRFGTQEQRSALAIKLTDGIDKSVAAAIENSFAKLRTALAPKLATGEGNAVFATFAVGSKSVEQISMEALKQMVLVDLSASQIGSAATQASRLAAVKALVSFGKIGDDYSEDLEAVKAQLTTIRNEARQAGRQDVLNHVRALIAAL